MFQYDTIIPHLDAGRFYYISACQIYFDRRNIALFWFFIKFMAQMQYSRKISPSGGISKNTVHLGYNGAHGFVGFQIFRTHFFVSPDGQISCKYRHVYRIFELPKYSKIYETFGPVQSDICEVCCTSRKTGSHRLHTKMRRLWITCQWLCRRFFYSKFLSTSQPRLGCEHAEYTKIYSPLETGHHWLAQTRQRWW